MSDASLPYEDDKSILDDAELWRRVAVQSVKLALRELLRFCIEEAWMLSNSRKMFEAGGLMPIG